MSRESRSPEYIKNDLNTNNDVFHSFDLRQDQLNYEDQDDDDGDVTPRVCQLDSVRELDEDKEIREITEKYFTAFFFMKIHYHFQCQSINMLVFLLLVKFI